LGSLFDKLRGKDKEETTRKPYVYHTTDSTTYGTVASTSESSSGSAYLDDPFYKLRKYCVLYPKESLCSEKQNSMKATLLKCDKLKYSGTEKQKKACGELLSIYCYIYSLKDVDRCYSGDYERYVPGAKKATDDSIDDTPSTTVRTTKSRWDAPTTKKTTERTTLSRWDAPTTKKTTERTTLSRWESPVTNKPSNESPFDGPVRSVIITTINNLLFL
jgi:hypothetical protein